MKIVTDTLLATQRRRQATILSLTGLATLAVGLYFNFTSQPLPAYAALVLGSVTAWTGIILADKWVRPPRPDKAIDEALKGAGSAFGLYHWVLPAEHVLAAPWGLTVLVVTNVEGPVRVKDERWREERPLWKRFLTLGRRPLGNPAQVADVESHDLIQALAAEDPALADVPVDAVVVFTHAGIDLTVSGSHVPALRSADLRDWLKEAKKRPRLSAAQRRSLDLELDSLAERKLSEAKQGRKR